MYLHFPKLSLSDSVTEHVNTTLSYEPRAMSITVESSSEYLCVGLINLQSQKEIGLNKILVKIKFNHLPTAHYLTVCQSHKRKHYNYKKFNVNACNKNVR